MRLWSGICFVRPRFLADLTSSDEPALLAQHQALVLGRPKEAHQWLLTDDAGQNASVPSPVRLASDDMTTLKRAAAFGLGITALPSYVCRPELEDGTLTRILPSWTAGSPQISLLMQSRCGMLPAVHAFSDFLKNVLPPVVAR